ncbi:MAG: hemoglobin [Halioglobus sp.]|jgi:hemoglobin
MLELPPQVKPYKTTPVFTPQNIPKGLLAEHSTKAGTWGVLEVDSGAIEYVVTQAGFEESVTIQAGGTAIIAPEHTHYVALSADAVFQIIFHRIAK